MIPTPTEQGHFAKRLLRTFLGHPGRGVYPDAHRWRDHSYPGERDKHHIEMQDVLSEGQGQRGENRDGQVEGGDDLDERAKDQADYRDRNPERKGRSAKVGEETIAGRCHFDRLRLAHRQR